MLNRDGWRCQINDCEAPATTVDHIVRRADEGTSELDNLRAACTRCNFGRDAEWTGAVPEKLSLGQRWAVIRLDLLGVPHDAERTAVQTML
ncbi:5-methylcytosine-specific restriction endonuclease McrA [Kitasatospora gansuensis]|uniref:5-methylcytosine-specific restriction endonuclease McrA n=1 Tax=Kitasatospora gansuensis TaxID=258050 RepID=A0A7W7SIC9_9ACTN|nr:5-methylcytosine-specific restriction endonuclease McrA [Kitasatospora gansuensis]